MYLLQIFGFIHGKYSFVSKSFTQLFVSILDYILHESKDEIPK